jgi:hypothetical protein
MTVRHRDDADRDFIALVRKSGEGAPAVLHRLPAVNGR